MSGNSTGLRFGLIRLVFLSGVMALSLLLSACVSSNTTSNTASYGGPSVSSASSKRTSAKRAVRIARRELRRANSSYRAIKRARKKNQRLLKRKRISSKQKKKLIRRLRSDKRDLRKAKRAIRKAERKLTRAQSREKRAVREIAKAKKRKVNAQRRLAAETKRKAAEKRRIAKAKKLREQKLAQKEVERKNPVRTATNNLFSPSDPALKNVNDYGARIDGSFSVAAVPVQKVNKRLYRQEVSYRSSHRPGTLVVDTGAKYLYLIKSGGKAMRYGIGVGKAGFEWAGAAYVGWKQKWPKWTPPEEMIERRPELAKYNAEAGGMPGGPANPLGARALYLMQGGVDTLYRLHGTPEWSSIGTAASSGCIRLMNQDIIDLYKRVPNGAKVVVI